jgi:hypothetical protein
VVVSSFDSRIGSMVQRGWDFAQMGVPDRNAGSADRTQLPARAREQPPVPLRGRRPRPIPVSPPPSIRRRGRTAEPLLHPAFSRLSPDNRRVTRRHLQVCWISTARGARFDVAAPQCPAAARNQRQASISSPCCCRRCAATRSRRCPGPAAQHGTPADPGRRARRRAAQTGWGYCAPHPHQSRSFAHAYRRRPRSGRAARPSTAVPSPTARPGAFGSDSHGRGDERRSSVARWPVDDRAQRGTAEDEPEVPSYARRRAEISRSGDPDEPGRSRRARHPPVRISDASTTFRSMLATDAQLPKPTRSSTRRRAWARDAGFIK